MRNPPMTGAEFKALREPVGDIATVADIFDVHRVTFSKWENDKSPIPGPARASIRILNERAAEKQAKIDELEQRNWRAFHSSSCSSRSCRYSRDGLLPNPRSRSRRTTSRSNAHRYVKMTRKWDRCARSSCSTTGELQLITFRLQRRHSRYSAARW